MSYQNILSALKKRPFGKFDSKLHIAYIGLLQWISGKASSGIKLSLFFCEKVAEKAF